MDRRAHCGFSLSTIVLSDSTNVRLADLSGMCPDEQALDAPRFFHSNSDGYVTVEPMGNRPGHTVRLNIINGLTYNYSINKFMETGSCLGTGNIIAGR